MKNPVIRNLALIALAVGLFFLGCVRTDFLHGRFEIALGSICWVFSLAILLVLANDGINYLDRLIKRRGKQT